MQKHERAIFINQTGLLSVKELLEKKNLVSADELVELWESKMGEQMLALEKKQRFIERKDRIVSLFRGDKHERFLQYVAEAEAAIDAFDPERGMKALEEGFKLDRDNYELSFFLGEMFFNDGNLDRAKSYLERTLEVQPDHFDAAVFYGVLLHERQDLKGAERWLRRAIQISQESFLPYFSLGAIYARKGKLLRAQKFLEKAVQLEPIPQALLPPRHDLLREGAARARHPFVPGRAEARSRLRRGDLPPRPLLSRPQLEPQSDPVLPGSAGAQSEQDGVPAGGQDLRRHLRTRAARRSGRRRRSTKRRRSSTAGQLHGSARSLPPRVAGRSRERQHPHAVRAALLAPRHEQRGDRASRGAS